MFNRFRIINKVQESQNIYSFYLKPSDEKEITHFQPGQHVNIRISLPGNNDTITRPYTLSSAPGQHQYRITVKREEGIVSSFLHDHVKPGDTLWISEPMGKFVLPKNSRKPVVLISAGVGITPMISMVEAIADEPDPRQVWLFHGSKNKQVRPMAELLKTLSDKHDNIRVHMHHSRPADDEIAGIDYDAIGRIELNFLKNHLPDYDADYYLCGPATFIETLSDGLRSLGISDEQIFSEYFGRVAIDKIPDNTDENDNFVKEQKPAEIRISLMQSEQSFAWNNSYGSILDLLEANGIFPPSSCRLGTCMSCCTGLLAGAVSYQPEPLAEPFEGDILLCCAKPQTNLELDI